MLHLTRHTGFGGGAAFGAVFRAAQSYAAASTSQVIDLTGAREGDLAVVCASTVTALAGPAGWTEVVRYAWTGISYTAAVYSRVLDAADIAAGSVTFTNAASGGHWCIAIYSGPTLATHKTSTESNTTSLSCTGFTKSGLCRAVVAWVADSDINDSFTIPGNMVQRATRGSPGNFGSKLCDIINPSDYTNGSALAFTGFVAGSPQMGLLIELT